MAYVPNAEDSTEPVESRTVESAALEFRTLKTKVVADSDRITAMEGLIPFLSVYNTGGASYVQRFSGNGTQTTFTLTVGTDSYAAVDIYINGVYQQKNTYTLTGTNVIEFSEAPVTGTENIEVKVSTLVAGAPVVTSYTQTVAVYGIVNSIHPDTGTDLTDVLCVPSADAKYLTVSGNIYDLPPSLGSTATVHIAQPVDSIGTRAYVGTGTASYFDGTTLKFCKPVEVIDGVAAGLGYGVLQLSFGPKNLADSGGITTVQIYFTATYKIA